MKPNTRTRSIGGVCTGRESPWILVDIPIAVRQAWAEIVGPTNGPLLPGPSTLTISPFHADLFVRPYSRSAPPTTHRTTPDRIMQFDISDVGCVQIQGQVIEKSCSIKECVPYM